MPMYKEQYVSVIRQLQTIHNNNAISLGLHADNNETDFNTAHEAKIKAEELIGKIADRFENFDEHDSDVAEAVKVEREKLLFAFLSNPLVYEVLATAFTTKTEVSTATAITIEAKDPPPALNTRIKKLYDNNLDATARDKISHQFLIKRFNLINTHSGYFSTTLKQSAINSGITQPAKEGDDVKAEYSSESLTKELTTLIKFYPTRPEKWIDWKSTIRTVDQYDEFRREAARILETIVTVNKNAFVASTIVDFLNVATERRQPGNEEYSKIITSIVTTFLPMLISLPIKDYMSALLQVFGYKLYTSGKTSSDRIQYSIDNLISGLNNIKYTQSDNSRLIQIYIELKHAIYTINLQNIKSRKSLNAQTETYLSALQQVIDSLEIKIQGIDINELINVKDEIKRQLLTRPSPGGAEKCKDLFDDDFKFEYAKAVLQNMRKQVKSKDRNNNDIPFLTSTEINDILDDHLFEYTKDDVEKKINDACSVLRLLKTSEGGSKKVQLHNVITQLDNLSDFLNPQKKRARESVRPPAAPRISPTTTTSSSSSSSSNSSSSSSSNSSSKTASTSPNALFGGSSLVAGAEEPDISHLSDYHKRVIAGLKEIIIEDLPDYHKRVIAGLIEIITEDKPNLAQTTYMENLIIELSECKTDDVDSILRGKNGFKEIEEELNKKIYKVWLTFLADRTLAMNRARK